MINITCTCGFIPLTTSITLTSLLAHTTIDTIHPHMCRYLYSGFRFIGPHPFEGILTQLSSSPDYAKYGYYVIVRLRAIINVNNSLESMQHMYQLYWLAKLALYWVAKLPGMLQWDTFYTGR